MKQNAKIYLPWGVSTLRCHLSFCCVQDCCPLCSHLLQGNWLPIRFVLHAIGMHILLSRQSTYFPASMCLRRCVDGLWLGVLSLVALQEAEPGKSCVNMNSVKYWKKLQCVFRCSTNQKDKHCAIGHHFRIRWPSNRSGGPWRRRLQKPMVTLDQPNDSQKFHLHWGTQTYFMLIHLCCPKL